MQINGTKALVTGANRGLGKAFAEALVARGATTVYATARNPDRIDIPGVVPLRLDITDPASIEAAAAEVGDLDILVNNAGISTNAPLLGPSTENIHREFDTNFWGTLNVTRAFAPRLAGGAILNVISALSWYTFSPASNGYAASKAAEWSLTNGIRMELAEQKTQVTALALAIADTDMMAAYDFPKIPPREVIAMALDGLEAGAFEVIADAPTANVKASLSGDPALFYADIPAALFG
ncbi:MULTISPECIES: SDR family oxidoreductase [Catenuloplanes]|uniref:NAD(P)-dependent dehydrogenase (Short-subunit alcohol dehydrogenase family) n=1 Tax=Catenuloplanes niger TaxID=587534 RepID=A0AAE3ZM24_9ACTN|nr:SDR family oxidoreductase [Catenuloplanes niger]MDR7320633.1 NAD(P)-dependent dehydrogenase (short-subunit alcohol dehydrogenase family) [Catenuloplanes niger]